MANVVLVVDMLTGFLERGHNLYTGDASRQIIPNVRTLIEKERDAGSEILFICDNHEPDDLEFQMFPVHCVRGTEEAEVIPELVVCLPNGFTIRQRSTWPPGLPPLPMGEEADRGSRGGPPHISIVMLYTRH